MENDKLYTFFFYKLFVPNKLNINSYFVFLTYMYHSNENVFNSCTMPDHAN